MQPRPAEMQMLNWNDLRYILAVSRGRTLAAAARLLGVDDTTVARRLVAVQGMIGAQLYQRLADGTLQLTTAGERAALHAEAIEREISALEVALSGADDTAAALRLFRSSSTISSFLPRKSCSSITRNCSWN
jgi:DNA-binding transcriptional LysR family regulator